MMTATEPERFVSVSVVAAQGGGEEGDRCKEPETG